MQDKTLLLETGCWYQLKVLKLLQIPGDRTYFICEDINGLKHLIPASYYDRYGITTGTVINCHLDRINCQGRFFFEPAHPVYEIGKSYRFDVIGINNYSCDASSNHYSAIVTDVFGQIWETTGFVARTELPENIRFLHCRVSKIRKARLILDISDKRLI